MLIAVLRSAAITCGPAPVSSSAMPTMPTAVGYPAEKGAARCPAPPLPGGALGADGAGRVGLVVGRGCGRALVLVRREVDVLVEVSQRVIGRQEGVIRAGHARHPGAGTPDREVSVAPSMVISGRAHSTRPSR